MDRTSYELKKNKEVNKPVLKKESNINLNTVPDKEYKEYLLSSKWKKKRKEAMELFGSCVLCNSNKELEVHHRTYKNFKNEDIPKDLVVLCSRCHAKYHFWKSGKKYQNRKRRKKTKPIIWRG